MKNAILTIVFLFAHFASISQPCTPDTNLTSPGFYPDSTTNLPSSQVNTFYSTVISAKFPIDTVHMGIVVTFDSIGINNVIGLPDGFRWVSNSESNFWPGGGNGCFVISGTTTNDGTFPIQIAIIQHANIGGMPVQIADTITYYQIIVQPPLLINITPTNPSICQGGSVTLHASGSYASYLWSTNETDQSITVNPLITTTYTVTVTDINQFQNSISTTVTVDPTYHFAETYEMCDGAIYSWHGNDYTTAGVYTASYQTSAGCDSIYEFTLEVNPVYNFSETHEMCDGDLYSWHGEEYSTAGVYTASYQTSAGCDSIYELTLTVNPSYEFVTNQNICQGEFFEWRGNTYDATGNYSDTYLTNSQCDSVYVLNLTVNPLPQQVVVLKNPSNGILPSGTNGQISLSTSVVGTKYWVTMGGALFTSEHNGTGSGLNLGNNYPAGSFDVWSRNQHECTLLQGTVNFVENTGTNKIVANVTFGTPASNFPVNHVKVVLYRETTDIGSNEVIVFEAEQLLNTNGQAEFNNLQPGDYYLGSFIQYPDNYNVAPHIYYQTSVVHEDAISIPVVEGTVFIASLHHVMIEENNGTNNGGGTVGTQDDKKSLNPLQDMVVILRDMDAEEIIGVSVTDINGQYAFENIPDNTNIQMFVTSFAHQNWIPYATQTGSSQTFNINFIVDGNSVYPEGTTGITAFELINIDFSIYPNPAKDILKITSNTEKGIMRIYDINGKLVQTELVFSHSEINISKLSSGTYVVVLTSENGEAGVQKFVKE